MGLLQGQLYFFFFLQKSYTFTWAVTATDFRLYFSVIPGVITEAEYNRE
jgi:hypothetical protein